jgi:hypothetical protein
MALRSPARKTKVRKNRPCSCVAGSGSAARSGSARHWRETRGYNGTNLLHVLLSDFLHLLRRRGLILIVALMMGAAVPLGASMAAASSSHRATAQVGRLSLSEPALADGTSPSPGTALAPDGSTPATSVRLPQFGGPEPTGPPPAPRPGARILVPSVGIQLAVVDYNDCTGNTAMTRVSAVRFNCTPAPVTQFVGHNPGVFTPLLRTHAGDRAIYQHDGVQDIFILRSPRRVSPQEAAQYSQDGSFAHALFATCAEPDSSAYWVFVADPLSGAASTPARAPKQSQATPPANPRPSPSPNHPGTTPVGGGGGGGGGGVPGPGPIAIPSPPPL